MIDIKRRKVLKGISASGAAVMAPLSLQAANPVDSEYTIAIAVDARHGRFKNSTSNEIINIGSQPVELSAQQPVGYKQTTDRYVTLHVMPSTQKQILNPGERLPVYARATLTKPSHLTSLPTKLVEQTV